MAATRIKIAAGGASIIVAAGFTATAVATDDESARAKLDSFEEVPLTLSTPGEGSFRASIDADDHRIRYTLRYEDLSGDVLQAHIHLGRRATAGGVSAFLCTNVGGGTASTPACPQEGKVSGTLRRADVLGPSSQGIDAREFDELVRALRAGATYVNVHTEPFTSGEIRGQIH